MKTAQILISLLLFSVPGLARTINLEPGQCLFINGTRVCAPNRLPDSRSVTEVESVTKRKNVFCTCRFGIQEVENPGDPMKGWWLHQVKVSTDGSSTRTTLNNYGLEKEACTSAVTEHPGCLVGINRKHRVFHGSSRKGW